jgi:hypothetical protein
MANPAIVRQIARQIVQAGNKHCAPGGDPDQALPIFQNLIDTYGQDAIQQAIDYLNANDGKVRIPWGERP